MIIHIWEDPTTIHSKVIETWLIKLTLLDKSLQIVRHFDSNNPANDLIIHTIKCLQDCRPTLVFPFVHRIKELLLYERDPIDADLLEEVAFDFYFRIPKQSIPALHVDLTYPKVRIEEGAVMIDETFDGLCQRIVSAHSEPIPITKDTIMFLMQEYHRLTWEELVSILDTEPKQLVPIIQDLLQQGLIKKSRLGTTQLIKLPSITHYCEGDECCCTQTHSS